MTLPLYIARQFLRSIMIALGGLMTLVLLLDTIELTRRTSGKSGVNFGGVMEMALMKAPEMIMRILPFAVLIGVMMTLSRLTRSSELVAARAAGISVWQFLRPGWVVTLSIGVLFVTVFNPIASAMLSRYEQLEARYISGKSSVLSLSSSGLWLRDFEPPSTDKGAVQERIFHAQGLDQQAMTLQRVIIFEYGAESQFLGRFDAKTARLNEGYWELRDAAFSQPGKPAEIIPELSLSTELTLEQIQDSFASPETLSFWELPAFIALLEEAGFSAIRHKLHFQVTLALPLLLIAMVFIGASFSLRNPRRGRIALLITGGIISGFLIYFFSDLIHAMGLSGSIPLILAAWVPPFATLLIGIWMMLHLEHG
jgi:lipopolysaccharide export system permease protein